MSFGDGGQLEVVHLLRFVSTDGLVLDLQGASGTDGLVRCTRNLGRIVVTSGLILVSGAGHDTFASIGACLTRGSVLRDCRRLGAEFG